MNKKFSKGMTIIETLSALMVLSIVIIGVLGGLYTASHIGETTKVRTNMIQKVKCEMEEIMGISYADIENDVENGELYIGPYFMPYILNTTVVREYEGNEEIGKVITLRIDWVQQERDCFERLVTFRRR